MLTRKFMTVREVADLTHVSEVTVRQWIKQGDLRAIDVGREFRIVPLDLESFLERHATIEIGISSAAANPAAAVSKGAEINALGKV